MHLCKHLVSWVGTPTRLDEARGADSDTWRTLRRLVECLGALLLAVLNSVGIASAEPVTLRLGHFPNITHVQALVAHGLSRQGRGWFEQRLGPAVKIEWYTYNA